MSTMRLTNGPALAQRGITVAPPSRWRNGLHALGQALSNYGQRHAATHLDRLVSTYAWRDASLAAQLRQSAADCRARADSGRGFPINEESN